MSERKRFLEIGFLIVQNIRAVYGVGCFLYVDSTVDRHHVVDYSDKSAAVILEVFVGDFMSPSVVSLVGKKLLL